MKTADELFDGSNAHLLDDSAVDPLVMDDLPNVAGQMQCSSLEFERRCRMYLQSEFERVDGDSALYGLICDAVRLARELSPVKLDRYGKGDRYGCYQLFTVQKLDSADGFTGCIPMLTLPKSLIGKTVKVTIEECP